jgi:hypothetical protein
VSTSLLAIAPITFEVASGGTTHAPLVMASVGVAPAARYVLDTGSDVHLLNEDLADELGLDKEPGEEGTDHTGRTMPSWNVGTVPVVVGGLDLTLQDVVAIPAPPPFPSRGIRGILSPHNLHPSAWCVLDLVENQLLLVNGRDSDVSAMLQDRHPTLELLRLPRLAEFRQVVIHAAVDGFDEVATLLDSGGKASEFVASALSGLSAQAAARLGGGVSGADYFGGSAGSQTLVVADHRLPIPELHIRDAMGEVPGLVGMDVIGGTVLVAAADPQKPVLWQVP